MQLLLACDGSVQRSEAVNCLFHVGLSTPQDMFKNTYPPTPNKKSASQGHCPLQNADWPQSRVEVKEPTEGDGDNRVPLRAMQGCVGRYGVGFKDCGKLGDIRTLNPCA